MSPTVGGRTRAATASKRSMRITLNQRIWRHAGRSSAATSAAAVRVALPHGRAMAAALPGSGSVRELHASRRSVATASSSPLLPANGSSRQRAQSPWLVDVASLQTRSVFTAGDHPDFDGEQSEEELQASITEEETPYLEMLELAYKGEKNWNVALDIFEDIVEHNGAGLTVNIATALVEVFSVRRRPTECLNVLRYTREQGIRPRIHAYSYTLACCYKEQKYSQALRVFEIMRSDGYVPKHVTYSRALSAALKASQHELVLEIFDDMLRNRIEPTLVTYNSILNSCARNGDVHSALGVLRAIRQRGLEMSQSTYHSLAICGGKTGQWELARDAYNGLREAGFEPAMTMYNSVIAAYAKGKRWDDIITLYDEMPTESKHLLQHAYLGATLMGFAKAQDVAMQYRGLEIFEQHVAMGKEEQINLFAHNAVLLCYLSTGQLDKVHAHAEEMREKGFKWDGLTYQNVVLAHLRSGDARTAQQLLSKHVKIMEYSTVCYRELIRYHSVERNDPLTACRLSMEMMQYNPRLSRQDWHTALDCALKSNNRAIYWNFRKWLKVRASMIIHEIPKELMLSDDEEPRPKNRYNKHHNHKNQHNQNHNQRQQQQQPKQQQKQQN